MVGTMSRRRLVLVVAFVAALLAVPAVPSAFGTSGTMNITGDTTLTEHHDGRVEIAADNVTLDCAGHSVNGPGKLSGVMGITVTGRTGVTVKNCVIRDFNSGFFVNSSDGNAYQDNVVSNVRQGFTMNNSLNNVLDGNSVSGASDFFAYGILGFSHGTSVTNNLAMDGAIGILVNDSDNLTITGNDVHDNGGSGIELGPSNDSTVLENISDRNGRGIVLSRGSTGNTVMHNTVADNDVGYHVLEASSNNTLVDNFAELSRFHGFELTSDTAGNSVDNNTSHRNGNYGFFDNTGNPQANTYSANKCIRNTLGGSFPSGLCNQSGSFGDDDGSIFELDIEWLADQGITAGCNPPVNDLFCPADNVTRGQMATFLVRALGLTPSDDDGPFTDHLGSVHRRNINALRIAGITSGCAVDRFCPANNVTRAQMGTFLTNALGLTPIDDDGGFVDHLGSVHRRNINALRISGITAGCNPPDNTMFCPADPVKRRQMAAFLRRALG